MKIWVDGDACPVVIKNILFKAAERTQTMLILVANQKIQVPRSRFIQSQQVSSGFDVADSEIIKRANAGDLVITNDIPLAAQAIDNGCRALSPRGELYTVDNIKPRLNMRDFMETLRSSGIQTAGPAALNQRDRNAFANHLDRLLTEQRQASK